MSVTAGCCQHFKVRMAQRGIVVLVTGQQDPLAAARAALKGQATPEPDTHTCTCTCASHGS